MQLVYLNRALIFPPLFKHRKFALRQVESATVLRLEGLYFNAMLYIAQQPNSSPTLVFLNTFKKTAIDSFLF